MGVFVARYSSDCARCPNPIEPGDTCSWRDSKPVHLSCVVTPYKPALEPCPKCWTLPAQNGACACPT